jgi:hypothetical protein
MESTTEKRSYLIQGLHALRIAKECFQDVQRESKGGLGEKLCKRYEKQIDAIYLDFISTPQFPKEVRDGVRIEWNSDVFAVGAIAEKLALVPPNDREMIENIIDGILNGEKISIYETAD